MVGFLRPCIAKLDLRFAAIAVGLVLGIGAILIVPPASAQGFGWLGKIFGGQPRPTLQADAPSFDRNGDNPHLRPRRRVAEPTRPPHDNDRLPAKDASVFVYVMGDAFGQNLASGLDEALADRRDVAIVHKAKDATGLATTDVFDWPRAIDAMLAAGVRTPQPGDPAGVSAAGNGDLGNGDLGKGVSGAPGTDVAATTASEPRPIDVAVMMIGSNDRQAINRDGATLKPGTPEWTAEYSKRVMAIDEAFRRKGIPFIWVGVPIARDDGFADDMAAFNDIYREAAAKTGTVYVDTWEAFSDDNGEFRTVGPDINGQMTRLRTTDGIYFTKAGSRKLAHFVEIHVRRALDGKMARAPVLEPTLPETPVPNVALARKPDLGPISDLAEPPVSRAGQLATAYRADARIEASIVKGAPQSIPVGRADDPKWPASGIPSP